MPTFHFFFLLFLYFLFLTASHLLSLGVVVKAAAREHFGERAKFNFDTEGRLVNPGSVALLGASGDAAAVSYPLKRPRVRRASSSPTTASSGPIEALALDDQPL